MTAKYILTRQLKAEKSVLAAARVWARSSPGDQLHAQDALLAQARRLQNADNDVAAWKFEVKKRKRAQKKAAKETIKKDVHKALKQLVDRVEHEVSASGRCTVCGSKTQWHRETCALMSARDALSKVPERKK